MKFELNWINRLAMGLVLIICQFNIYEGASAPSKEAETLVKPNNPRMPVSFLDDPAILNNTLIIGWLESEPYNTPVNEEVGVNRYSWLDVELARSIANTAGLKVEYTVVEWDAQIDNIKTGKQHFAASATFTEERAKFAYFSDAYRKEENSFFVRKGDGVKFVFKSTNMKEFIESIKINKAKIAIKAGMAYASDDINNFINDPENKGYFVVVENTYESIDLLLKKEIDGILGDRMNASAGIWRSKNIDKIEEVYLGINTQVHFMFSKKSVPESFVKKFNEALKTIQSNGTYSKITKEYMYPILILQTIERPWFFFLEAFAIMSLVFSGLLISYRERYNLFGTLLLAFISMCGGVIRDIIVNRPKIGVVANPLYGMGVLISVVLGFVMVWSYQLLFKSKANTNQTQNGRISYWLIEVMDAFGLAAFTVTGVVVTLISQIDPLWLWGPIMAALSTTGGGILRDIVRRKKDIQLLKNDFYGEIAIIWGVVLSLALTWSPEILSPESMFNWIVFVVFGVFLTRAVVKLTNFKGIPFNLKGLS
jgi:polar amino acid transport system substrate-binding protein